MPGLLLWTLLSGVTAVYFVSPYFTDTHYHLSVSSYLAKRICVQLAGLDELVITTTETDSLACGYFAEEIETTGWNRLHVRFQDTTVGYYAAGLVEGVLMSSIILSHLNNMFQVYHGDFDALYEYYTQKDAYLLSQTGSDPVLAGLRAQLEGILDGANFLEAGISLEDLYFINTDGDLDNLLALNSPLNSFLGASLPHPRCSALLKVVNSELFIGHATMEDYREMNRVLKSYQWTEGAVVMSSYPGAISSTDDFMLTSQGITVMETSLTAEQPAEYRTDKLFAFYRLRKAVYVSDSAEKFIEEFLKDRDETYSSSWMVVDFQQYAVTPESRSFYVLETTPGYAHYQDMSADLQQTTYWASYNDPAFPTTPARSANSMRQAQFSLLQANITSLPEFQKVLRFNGYSPLHCNDEDPLQPCKPNKSISSRSDLAKQGRLFGATDAKVTSKAAMEKLGLWAVAGPTTEDLPPFEFPAEVQVQYLPRKWDFPWVYADIQTNARD